MPVAPYTWQVNDFVTASRLNYELRRFNGQPYLANGPGFHTQRPVFRSFYSGGGEFNAAGWQQQFNGAAPGVWMPVIDTAAFLGGRGDLAGEGAYLGTGVPQSGGAPASTGGFSLFWSHQPFATAASGASAAGIGFNPGAAPTYTGTQHPVNGNGFGVTPWAAGILDASSKMTGYYYNNGTALPTSGGNQDGSGQPPRQHALWASVYPQNGHTVASIPSITTGYGPTSALTSAALNAQIQQTNYLLNMPPLLQLKAAGSTSCTSGVTAAITYGGGSIVYDTYSGFNTGNSTYTVPLPGLYLVCSFSGFDSPAGGSVVNGVSINGIAFWGPYSQSMGGGPGCNSSKAQIFSLNQGDTIQHIMQQTTGATINTSTANPSNMLILWLGASGAPASLPTVPDFTYLFAAGTPASQMPSVLNSYLANDLQFLLQKPYTMAYQTAAQGAFANNSNQGLVLQSNTGIVHGDSAVSYGGWNGTSYVAPRSGWYLCVEEFYMNTPNGATNYYYTGTFVLNPAGVGPDFYETKLARQGVSGGASAMGLYYLRAGDSITPTARWGGATNTLATFVQGGFNSHFEAVWVSA